MVGRDVIRTGFAAINKPGSASRFAPAFIRAVATMASAVPMVNPLVRAELSAESDYARMRRTRPDEIARLKVGNPSCVPPTTSICVPYLISTR